MLIGFAPSGRGELDETFERPMVGQRSGSETKQNRGSRKVPPGHAMICLRGWKSTRIGNRETSRQGGRGKHRKDELAGKDQPEQSQYAGRNADQDSLRAIVRKTVVSIA
jgi:hypothetical protein